MFIGVDIGGSHIGVGVLKDGNLIEVIDTSIDSSNIKLEEMIETIFLTVSVIVKLHGGINSMKGIGIGCPGQCKEDILIAASNFPSLGKNIPLCDLISNKFGGIMCILLNDADAAFSAEVWRPDSNLSRENKLNAAMITLGTGIGLSLLLNGEFYQGANGLIEGGHMIIEMDGRRCGCGQKGCIEAYASALNTATRMAEAESLHKSSQIPGDSEYEMIDPQNETASLNSKSVFDKAAGGNKLAISILDETTEKLAVFCINICRIVDPSVIIIGGGMAQAGDQLLNKIRHFIKLKGWTVLPNEISLQVARSAANGGILGAALAVERKYKQGPKKFVFKDLINNVVYRFHRLFKAYNGIFDEINVISLYNKYSAYGLSVLVGYGIGVATTSLLQTKQNSK